jgi:RNA polymerase sigma factor (sigma-70 family)
MTSPASSACPVPESRRNEAIEAWFRESYPRLLADLMALGAGFDEAKELAGDAAVSTIERWEAVSHPYAYARKVAFHLLIKSRERGPHRLTERLIQNGRVMDSGLDPGLTAWEDKQWVLDLLDSLPPAQRKVIACVIDDLSTKEAATLLGKTPDNIRRALADARKRLKHDLAKVEATAMAKDPSRPSPAVMAGSKEAK